MNPKENKGLTAEEARKRLEEFGPNQIFSRQESVFWA